MNTQELNANIGSKVSAKSEVKYDQYLTFVLANEEYGVNILSVVEIRGFEQATPLPVAQSYVKGVINLRGNIIPVINLRSRFGIEEIPPDALTVCIVLQVSQQGNTRTIGVIVDAVSDVCSVEPSSIQPKPDICNTVAYDYIHGLVNITHDGEKNKLIILLSIDHLLDLDEIVKLDNVELNQKGDA